MVRIILGWPLLDKCAGDDVQYDGLCCLLVGGSSVVACTAALSMQVCRVYQEDPPVVKVVVLVFTLWFYA